MSILVEIKRPAATKTSNLKDIKRGYNKFKELAETAQKYEQYAIELAKLSGKIKRRCKELHLLVEKGTLKPRCYEYDKKLKYSEKINKKLNGGADSLNSMLIKWCEKIEQTHNHYLSDKIPNNIRIDVLDLYETPAW